jgi:hypothetical protein
MVVIINMSIILAGIFGEMENYHYLRMIQCTCPIIGRKPDEFDCELVTEI